MADDRAEMLARLLCQEVGLDPDSTRTEPPTAAGQPMWVIYRNVAERMLSGIREPVLAHESRALDRLRNEERGRSTFPPLRIKRLGMTPEEMVRMRCKPR